MHYKNGRAAKNGDKIMVFPSHGAPYVGVMYDSTPGNNYCNGKVAVISPSDPAVNLQEALHLDDVRAFLPRYKDLNGNYTGQDLSDVPDSSVPVEFSEPVPVAVAAASDPLVAEALQKIASGELVAS